MVIYRERLTPNVGIHVALLLLLPLGFGMLAPINIVGGIINAVSIYALGIAWLVFGAPLLVVTTDSLRAGRATISRDELGAATVVERADRAGALADARAWKVIRAWIPRGVRVEIADANDPAPHWYLSSRHPEKLVAALTTR
jgi:hypothetical protein